MHVHQETRELCEESSCPVSAGDFVVSHGQVLTAYAPPVSHIFNFAESGSIYSIYIQFFTFNIHVMLMLEWLNDIFQRLTQFRKGWFAVYSHGSLLLRSVLPLLPIPSTVCFCELETFFDVSSHLLLFLVLWKHSNGHSFILETGMAYLFCVVAFLWRFHPFKSFVSRLDKQLTIMLMLNLKGIFVKLQLILFLHTCESVMITSAY